MTAAEYRAKTIAERTRNLKLIVGKGYLYDFPAYGAYMDGKVHVVPDDEYLPADLRPEIEEQLRFHRRRLFFAKMNHGEESCNLIAYPECRTWLRQFGRQTRLTEAGRRLVNGSLLPNPDLYWPVGQSLLIAEARADRFFSEGFRFGGMATPEKWAQELRYLLEMIDEEDTAALERFNTRSRELDYTYSTTKRERRRHKGQREALKRRFINWRKYTIAPKYRVRMAEKILNNFFPKQVEIISLAEAA